MTDSMTPAQRSRCMAAIRSRDTVPELTVRKVLHALGYRFRVHVKTLPGKPDIVLPHLHAIIFVHGCFWHLHSCRDGRIPETKRGYWFPKLQGNRLRDQRHRRKLRQLGWRVLTVWDCQTRDCGRLAGRLHRFLRLSRPPQ